MCGSRVSPRGAPWSDLEPVKHFQTGPGRPVWHFRPDRTGRSIFVIGPAKNRSVLWYNPTRHENINVSFSSYRWHRLNTMLYKFQYGNYSGKKRVKQYFGIYYSLNSNRIVVNERQINHLYFYIHQHETTLYNIIEFNSSVNMTMILENIVSLRIILI